MKLVYATPEDDARYAKDCAQYRLAWKCCDCAHVVSGSGRCSLEYPNHELANAESFVSPSGTYVFCKHFELT
jgi:hypothetical protein